MPFDRNGLDVLSRDACLRLLGSTSLGRVALSIGALPVVLPVTYGLVDGDIVFRTVEGTKLAGAAANAVVAFEVDSLDEDDGTGWSVLVIGMAEVVSDPDERLRADDAVPPTWLPAEPTHIVRVRANVVTGRRLTSPARRPAPVAG